MIPDFSPPAFTQSGPTITLKTFSDLCDSLTKLNAWVSYTTNFQQSQLIAQLNAQLAALDARLTALGG